MRCKLFILFMFGCDKNKDIPFCIGSIDNCNLCYLHVRSPSVSCNVTWFHDFFAPSLVGDSFLLQVRASLVRSTPVSIWTVGNLWLSSRYTVNTIKFMQGLYSIEKLLNLTACLEKPLNLDRSPWRVHEFLFQINLFSWGLFSSVLFSSVLFSSVLFFLQIKFQPNDHCEIKELADEIKNLEGIQHKSLVRYYGMELHRVRNNN